MEETKVEVYDEVRHAMQLTRTHLWLLRLLPLRLDALADPWRGLRG